MRRPSILAVGSLVTIVAACGAAAREDRAAEMAQVHSRSEALVAAEAAQDADRAITFWADDAVIQPAGSPQIQGRDAVAALYREFFDSGLREFEGTTSRLEVAAAGDLAYEYGINRMLFAGPDGELLDVGKYLAVWKKLDGDWFVQALSFTSDAPAPIALPAQDRVADERVIRELVQATGTALNARDWSAAAAVFAEGGDLIVSGSPRVSGRAAIREFWERGWASAPAERRITLTIRSLRFLSDEAAVVECTAEFSAGEPARDRATYVLTRAEGNWQVAALRVMQAEGS